MTADRTTIAPVRLRLSRAKGFNLQAHSRAVNGLEAVKVDRSTEWGNPFRVGCSVSMRYPDGRRLSLCDPIEDAEGAVAWFKSMWSVNIARHHGLIANYFSVIRGKNLACWCAIDAPCHADVLLEIANRPICEAV